MSTNNTSKWFKHDADSLEDPKIMLLLTQFGWEGFGLYWMLIQRLCKQPEYSLPLILLDSISRVSGVSREKLEAIVLKFDLFESDGVSFYSPSLIRRMEPFENRMRINSDNAKKGWEKRKINAIAMRSQCDGNEDKIREDKIREDKIREDKIRKDEIRKQKSTDKAALADLTFVDESFLSIWNKWLQFKEELKDPYKTHSGMQSQYVHLVKISGNDPAIAQKIVEKSIRKEWKGLFPLDDKENTTPGEDPVQKIMNDIKRAREQ